MVTPVTESELAYTAGFFDGEGTIMVRDRIQKGCRNPHHALVAKLCNTDRPILDWLQAEFGGTVSIHAHGTDLRHRLDAWSWTLGGRLQVVTFLRAIEPHLRVKRKQAQLAIQLSDLIGGRPRGLPLRPDEIAARQVLADELLAQPGRGHRRREEVPVGNS